MYGFSAVTTPIEFPTIDRKRDRRAGDRQVLNGAQCVHAEIGARRDGAVAQQIMLDARWFGFHALTRRLPHRFEARTRPHRSRAAQ